MIELIYNEEEDLTTEEKLFEEPKNVKQIGEPKSYKKIYIEDYVHTFLNQYSQEKENGMKVAVLFGKSERCQGKRCLYIKSALPVKEMSEKQGKYCFTDNVWGEIYRQSEKYFPGQEIIGWFLATPGFPVEKTATIEETHRTYFSGADKVLFMMEPVEGESGFFGYDGNRFARQSGYYIYYEKNEPMQNYLIEKNRSLKKEMEEEKPDIVMANFRKIVKEKHEKNELRKKQAISASRKIAALLLLLAAGMLLKNQTDQIQLMEKKLNELSGKEAPVEASSEEVIIEDLPGEVEEQPEEQMEEEALVAEVQEEIAGNAESELPVTGEEQNVTESEKENQLKTNEPIEEATAETPVYEEYTVQEGDTLAKISRDIYGTDEKIEEICALNGIENGDYIQVGEIILLP